MHSGRARLFKNRDKDSDELRRRRQDQSLELRKQKKDEQLQKRRNIVLADLDEQTVLKEKNKESIPVDYDSIVANMKSTDADTRFLAIQQCRKVLSRAKNPPIDEFYDRNCIKLLVDNLIGPDNIAFESAWAITNIASGDSKHTVAVAQFGAIPQLVKLLDHTNETIAEQSVWALGNIAGDGSSLRDQVIKAGVVDPCIRFLERVYEKPAMVSNITWMLSNLCRNKSPSPPRETIERLLPVLKELLSYPNNSSVIVDAAWALAYASDAANEFIDLILDSGCVPILIKLLASNQSNIVSPSLRAVGNLVIGDDRQTQTVLNMGLLSYVPSLLSNGKSNIVKEACWMLSNITAGTREQIDSVVMHNIIPCVVQVLNTAEFRVQKEACWVISNMINGGTVEHCHYLFTNRVIESLSGLLGVGDVKVLLMVLEALTRLFTMAEERGTIDEYCLAMETCQGLDRLEQLQDHDNERVYNAAYEMVARFFSESEDLGEPEQEVQPTPSTSANPPNTTGEPLQFMPQQSGQNAHFDF